MIGSVMSWVQNKAQTELSKQCNTKKQSKLKGIPKLENANDAGTKHSIDCTLIPTEGDSVKSIKDTKMTNTKTTKEKKNSRKVLPKSSLITNSFGGNSEKPKQT